MCIVLKHSMLLISTGYIHRISCVFNNRFGYIETVGTAGKMCIMCSAWQGGNRLKCRHHLFAGGMHF